MPIINPTKSYSGEEGNVVKVIEEMMKSYDFDDIHIDKYGNIIGGIIGQHPGKTLVLMVISTLCQ
ncbi:putative peptidase [Proteus penneri ATCC 35198]|nr:putative peptidase [Proteus penneri ATCC 35198]